MPNSPGKRSRWKVWTYKTGGTRRYRRSYWNFFFFRNFHLLQQQISFCFQNVDWGTSFAPRMCYNTWKKFTDVVNKIWLFFLILKIIQLKMRQCTVTFYLLFCCHVVMLLMPTTTKVFCFFIYKKALSMAILSVLFMTFFAKSNLSKFHFLSLK